MLACHYTAITALLDPLPRHSWVRQDALLLGSLCILVNARLSLISLISLLLYMTDMTTAWPGRRIQVEVLQDSAKPSCVHTSRAVDVRPLAPEEVHLRSGPQQQAAAMSPHVAKLCKVLVQHPVLQPFSHVHSRAKLLKNSSCTEC